MRCCDVEALWDEMRDGVDPHREHVIAHLRECPPCQELYQQFEGVAYRLSCLPEPEPSCNLAKKIIEHISQLSGKIRSTPVFLTHVESPIGRLHVGFRESGITYVAIDRGEEPEAVVLQIRRRLHRRVELANPPEWVHATIELFFQTGRLDSEHVDISDLTPFEQAVLRAAAQIPRGQVRSYAWLARQVGHPKAARAVGQVMAKNPLPLLFPCHRVVDSSGALHNYGYGIDMKARLLKLEGYHPRQ
ncbi:MAG: methylated-DNA--[protein]-cysteine S-methyltransferase [Candidatus Eremiobacteraeota bacterium]|nr:methylated-DNA--[protein]-cysteine S-methyltransferase [Candidatus Eremiobacteraeota bacterium]